VVAHEGAQALARARLGVDAAAVDLVGHCDVSGRSPSDSSSRICSAKR
jgi:hypothetical protein